MRRVIEELWFGNICPGENTRMYTPEVKKLVDLIEDNRKALCEGLTEAQKDRLTRYDDCIDEMGSIAEREAFAMGFRLGLTLAAEVFCCE